jgi:uncharacterized protein YjiS (DUF1127 family)
MRFAHVWRGKWTIIHRRANNYVALQYSRGCPAATTPRSTRPLDWNETMNAPMTQDQFTYSLGNLSYVDYSYDEPPVTTVEAPTHGIGHWLGRIVAGFANWRRQQATLREMDMLTERELSDIGLSRSDVPRVFDPGFVADHGRGRDFGAY